MKIFLFSVLLCISNSLAAHVGHCEDTPLGGTMAEVKKLNKQLNKALRKHDYSLARGLVGDIRRKLATGGDEIPLKLRTSDSRAIEEYKKDYQSFLNQLDDFARVIENGVVEEIRQSSVQLRKTIKASHTQYRKDCH